MAGHGSREEAPMNQRTLLIAVVVVVLVLAYVLGFFGGALSS